MATEYIKCTACKCLRHITDEYEVYKGTRRKTCLKCKEKRNKNKCVHGKQKNLCKECGGASICDHGKRKSRCKECDGSEFCEHDKFKSYCKECDGSSICEHGKQKRICKKCVGSSICEHGNRKNTCKECDPSGHLRNIVSSRVRKALNSDKSKTSLEYLGCTIEQFKEHIGFQFETGMNWDNFGKIWQIDHIIPIKYKQDGEEPSLEDTIERLHWTNTQPLFSEENKSKGNRFIGKNSEYDKTVKAFCCMYNAFI